MRKFMTGCGLLLLATVSTRAQENRGVEVSGDYQYVRFHPGPGSTAKVVRARSARI